MGKKQRFLEKVATELNNVMQYGQDENGEIVNEEELIDVSESDDNLETIIRKCCLDDLALNDQSSFSEDVWQYFVENELTPPDPDNNDSGDDDQESEPEPAPKKAVKKEAEKASKEAPAKKEAKAAKPKEEKEPKEKAQSNESIAAEIVKNGGGLEEVTAAFAKIYKDKGKDDEFVEARSKIYYNIGLKLCGKAPAKIERKKAEKAEAAPKEKKEAKAENPVKKILAKPNKK